MYNDLVDQCVSVNEDAQEAIPCNPRSEEHSCTREADWCLTMICCGAKTFLCDEHNQLNNALVDLIFKLDAEASCGYCGVIFRGSEIFSAEIVTPLR